MGTRVCIVRSEDRAPRSLTRCTVGQLEGKFGRVLSRRRPPLEAYRVELELGHGTVELEPKYLEPVISSRTEAEELLRRTLEDDGEDTPPPGVANLGIPAPLLHDQRTLPGHEDFDDDSPLSDLADDSPLSDISDQP